MNDIYLTNAETVFAFVEIKLLVVEDAEEEIEISMERVVVMIRRGLDDKEDSTKEWLSPDEFSNRQQQLDYSD